MVAGVAFAAESGVYARQPAYCFSEGMEFVPRTSSMVWLFTGFRALFRLRVLHCCALLHSMNQLLPWWRSFVGDMLCPCSSVAAALRSLCPLWLYFSSTSNLSKQCNLWLNLLLGRRKFRSRHNFPPRAAFVAPPRLSSMLRPPCAPARGSSSV